MLLAVVNHTLIVKKLCNVNSMRIEIVTTEPVKTMEEVKVIVVRIVSHDQVNLLRHEHMSIILILSQKHHK